MSLPEQAASVMASAWNLVQGAVSMGLTAAETSAAAKQAYAEIGVTPTFADYTGIAQLYGYARRIEASANQLAASAPDTAITSSMIAEAPWARPLAEQNASPLYQYRYQAELQMADGSTRTYWWTAVRSSVSGTAADVQAMIDQAAAQQALASTSQATPITSVISASQIQILAV